ncbi:DUF4962 domain-containing protein [Puniceicoccales bacterium CK1056]|uniref:DUF4962 domain-containing protein n=1 Tax=Oceanipulchritudo coccoides TaxID=2706888 RepID=A0A6B2M1K9_9BACT|nr:heparinase II/III family protein [Oceanipulchritudo coccoides]NDV62266.1 DUF4962 domain-containing protein [Oceanipulchritudo coccoides]
MNKNLAILITLAGSPLLLDSADVGLDPFKHVPEEAPRTWVLSGQKNTFIQFNSTGNGKAYLERLKEDLDTFWMDWPIPEEPESYGDPDPRRRTSEQVDKWRGMQDLSGQLTGVAEAATLIWLLTDEEPYLEKAKAILLLLTKWDPLGPTGIDYNDEAHFRLFRKLPQVYDQIRTQLSDTERQQVLDHFRVRGGRNMASIMEHGVPDLTRNSVENEPASHSVRFMAMTGLAALALWDDLPEARDWWEFVYTWYRDIFTPWGGDDGGWAEGPAYWRGVYEHAIFQDALFAIGDPLAYAQSFWRNTGYFQVYFVQPYPTTGFGDLSNAGQFNMEPGVCHFLAHLGRVTNNGYLLSYTDLYSDPRPLPVDLGIEHLYRSYPTAAESWVRDFIGAKAGQLEREPLSELPGSRLFADVGWVSMHSDLGNPENDIMLSFKSSPYGSFSHSHADQNSFILNAYGEQLAINSGYREYHRSQMHKYYTRQTISKNNILISRQGQQSQDKNATGKILRFEESDRAVWTTGDATVAYNTRQSRHDTVRKAIRDIIFIDNRYFVIRDHVLLKSPGRIDWLLHARDPMTFHEVDGSVVIERNGVYLYGRLRAYDNTLQMKGWTGFPVEVDPKYKDPGFINSQVYLREPAVDQAHFQANTLNDRDEQTIFAVLWPSRDAAEASEFKMELIDREGIEIQRPDGKIDRIRLTDGELSIESL